MPDLDSLRRRLDHLPVEPSQVLAGALVVVVAVVAGVSWVVARPGPDAVRSAGGTAATSSPPAEQILPFAESGAWGAGDASGARRAGEPVVVHVSGAVVRPGLVDLVVPADGRRVRVADAVAAAGGPLPDADLDRLNLAQPVADGERVHVPRRGEAVPSDSVGSSAAAGDRGPPALVDLNTATVEQLDVLPGIGPATARAIVEHRTRRGRFRSVNQLLEVRGIGPAKLAELKGRVRV